MVRGEVGMLRGEEGFGVRGDVLLMVRQVRGEGLGAAGGSVWLRRAGDSGWLVIRLRLRGDVRLVRWVQVELAYVDRMGGRFLAEEGVESLGGQTGTRGEDLRPVRKMGVWQQRGERGGKHVREVRRREVLGRVLLHVNPLPPGVQWRMHLWIRPRVHTASPFLLERPRVCRRSSSHMCPCVNLRGACLCIRSRRPTWRPDLG